MNGISKILVRTPNWIGDHVMAMPFYENLRRLYRGCSITFLSPDSLAEFQDHALRDFKIVLSKEERKSFKQVIKKAVSLRKEKYDLAISLPNSWSSAFFLFLTGAKNRVGFSLGGNEMFYHSSLRWTGNSNTKHKSEIYFSLLNYITAKSNKLTPVNKEEQSRDEKIIVVAPGASIALREYPHFSELLYLIGKTFPNFIIKVIGSKSEEKFKTQLQRLNLPNVVDMIGKTSLKEVVEICSHAKLVVCNDSGVAHISATMAETNTIVLMGPGDPKYILPVGGKAHALRLENLRCSPCDKAYCGAAYGYQACLKGLAPELIIEKMKSLTL